MKTTFLFIFFFTGFVYCQSFDMKVNLKNDSTKTFSIEDIKKMSFGSITGINEESQKDLLIKSFKLNQNYPNPFNPSTTITYQIPSNSFVRVNIYDINGQLIKELLNENQSTGEYRITWDGTNQYNSQAASGVYIYSVRCNDHILSRQMILLK